MLIVNADLLHSIFADLDGCQLTEIFVQVGRNRNATIKAALWKFDYMSDEDVESEIYTALEVSDTDLAQCYSDCKFHTDMNHDQWVTFRLDRDIPGVRFVESVQ